MTLFALALAAAAVQAAPAPAAPAAPAAAAARLSTATATIGDLLAIPAAKAILEKHIPGISSHPHLPMVSRMTLKAVQPMSQGQVTPAHLTAIDAELAALPAD